MGLIKKIRIQNFRSLEDFEMDIKPLTYLLGPNSSGKSNVMKALMFLNKNLFPLNNDKLIFKLSEDIDLVSYDDTVYNNETDRDIKVIFYLDGYYRFPVNPIGGFTEMNPIGKFIPLHEPHPKEPEEKIDMIVEFTLSLDDGIKHISFSDSQNKIDIGFDKIKYGWDYNKSCDNIEPVFSKSMILIERLVLTRDILDGVIKQIPFSLDFNRSYDGIYNDFRTELKEKHEYITKEEIMTSLKLFYQYYGLIPVSLKIFLDSYHSPTVRKSPKKIYELNDKTEFDEKEYYNFLNVFYSQQKILENEYDNLKINDTKERNSIEKVVFVLDKIENSRKHFDDSEIIKIFTIFENTNYNYADDVDRSYDSRKNYTLNEMFEWSKINKTLIENEYYSLLEKLEGLPEDIGDTFFGLYSSVIKSIGDTRKWYSRCYPYFLRNLSVMLNHSLSKLNFNNFIYIEKNEDIGKILVYNNATRAKTNVINESSGFLQVFPVLYGLDMAHSVKPIERIKGVYHYLCKSYDYFTDDLDVISKSKMSCYIEQPELHLHPKMQATLAELIVSVVNNIGLDSTLLIETHSEHIIRKTQVLIARKEVDKEKIGKKW